MAAALAKGIGLDIDKNQNKKRKRALSAVDIPAFVQWRWENRHLAGSPRYHVGEVDVQFQVLGGGRSESITDLIPWRDSQHPHAFIKIAHPGDLRSEVLGLLRLAKHLPSHVPRVFLHAENQDASPDYYVAEAVERDGTPAPCQHMQMFSRTMRANEIAASTSVVVKELFAQLYETTLKPVERSEVGQILYPQYITKVGAILRGISRPERKPVFNAKQVSHFVDGSCVTERNYRECLEIIERNLNRLAPPFLVEIHGDPHCRNVLWSTPDRFMLIDPKSSDQLSDYLYDVAKIAQSLTGHAHIDGRGPERSMRYELRDDFDFEGEPLILMKYEVFNTPTPEQLQPALDAVLGNVEEFAERHDDGFWRARFYFVLSRNYLSATEYFDDTNAFRALYSKAVHYANLAVSELEA